MQTDGSGGTSGVVVVSLVEGGAAEESGDVLPGDRLSRVDGALVWPPRGTAGFGYDPAFLPDGHSRTFGEMTSIEKHGLPPIGLGLSHRAKAFVKLAEICLT